jgi:integrase
MTSVSGEFDSHTLPPIKDSMVCKNIQKPLNYNASPAVSEFNSFLYPATNREWSFIMGKARVLRINKEQKEQNETWDEALQLFLWWKQAQGVSKRTVEDYKLHVTMFFKRYPEAWRSTKGLKMAVFEYMGQNIKPTTYNLRLIYLRAFFNWCISQGLMSENPFNELKKRKTEGRIVSLDEDTLKKLICCPISWAWGGLDARG